MIVAEARNAMTPADFIQFLTTKPPVGTALILTFKSGYVVIAIGAKEKDVTRFANFEGMPVVVVTDGLSVAQLKQAVEDGQKFFASHGPMSALQEFVEFKDWLSSPATA